VQSKIIKLLVVRRR